MNCAMPEQAEIQADLPPITPGTEYGRLVLESVVAASKPRKGKRIIKEMMQRVAASKATSTPIGQTEAEARRAAVHRNVIEVFDSHLAGYFALFDG